MILSVVTIDKLCKYVETELNKTDNILKDKLCTSRSKLPCTYCGVEQSTTWRPGPCGPSTLCNKCGVAYMDSGRRNRSIDLIMHKNEPVWCKRDASSWEWVIERKAPFNDHGYKCGFVTKLLEMKLKVKYHRRRGRELEFNPVSIFVRTFLTSLLYIFFLLLLSHQPYIVVHFLKKIHKRIPMGRLANSDEYQGTLIWMLSDASSYLNGAIIPVDGGRTVW